MLVNKLVLVSLLSLIGFNQPGQTKDFEAFSHKFVSGYKALHIPGLNLGYMQNMQGIKSIADVNTQANFFTGIQQGLKNFKPAQLTPNQQQDFELISYETGLNLERLKLEKEWLQNPKHTLTDSGLYKQTNGKQWYAYFLKKWLSGNVTPDEIYQFGLKEVDRVKGHIETIRKETGLSEDAFYKHLNDPSFFISDPKVVQQSFIDIKKVIYANMGNVFTVRNIPPLAIEKGADANLAQTPGYYNANTFYYNLFDKPYNKRQVDWLFIHEAVPGHHYQSTLDNSKRTSEVQQLFFYLGFAEGWGAYAEELGKQLGVYKTPYDELGKWEWDIVRSVRVPMDIGLNYYGWTDEQALAYWKKNICNQDDIAMREITRVKRWPAQAIAYKYGAGQIMEWKEILQKQQGSKFDIKAFHDKVLLNGPLPLFMLRKKVLSHS